MKNNQTETGGSCPLEISTGQGLGRRAFLLQQLKGALWLTLGLAGVSTPRRVWAAALPDIGIARGLPGPAARAAVNLLGGMGAFVKPGARVVIKPNMSFAHPPERGTNTHPEVVRELAAMCREAGAAKVRVLDHPLHRQELCIEGVRQACAVFEDDMVHALSKPRFFKPARIPEGREMKETDVMQDVLEADVLIAAPTAKSHGSTGVSLSMKGMMGLVYNRWEMHSRFDLSTAIVDLATLLKPQLVVIDATRVLSTNGPSGPGKVIELNSVIASRDMVAADAQAVEMGEWYGQRMKPRQVPHIRLAHERGLGRMDLDKLVVKQTTAA